jgi:hypothetical protein
VLFAGTSLVECCCIAGSAAVLSQGFIQDNGGVRSFHGPAGDACRGGAARGGVVLYCARDYDAGYSVMVRRCTNPLYHDRAFKSITRCDF